MCTILDERRPPGALLAALQEDGVCVLQLSKSAGEQHARAFRACRGALDLASAAGENPHPYTIPDGEASANCTGIHAAGSLSRYNIHREGVVFSNNHFFPLDRQSSGDLTCAEGECSETDVKDTTATLTAGPEVSEITRAPAQASGHSHEEDCEDLFEMEMRALWDEVCALGLTLLEDISTALDVSGYFEAELGPIKEHSQWHIKRYRPDRRKFTTTCDRKVVLLPTHTDPSLISIVIHDRPGQCSGAMGLEYLNNKGNWCELPLSGHRVATCFVGSILNRITGGTLTAAKHRVAVPPGDIPEHTCEFSRVVATFFLRPAPTAMLRLIPAAAFAHLNVKEMSFLEWNLRVAKNYEKKRHKHAPLTQSFDAI
eukprot:m.169972 g.169972  ORF g.169972 m.169972 type:complete len:371 (-) comp14783_c0_seq11:2714-3826(-)